MEINLLFLKVERNIFICIYILRAMLLKTI